MIVVFKQYLWNIIIGIMLLDLLARFRPRTMNKLPEGDSEYNFFKFLFEINSMKHEEYRITAVNERIVSEYTSQIVRKICINQKGFGQGMGATNAQNRLHLLNITNDLIVLVLRFSCTLKQYPVCIFFNSVLNILVSLHCYL